MSKRCKVSAWLRPKPYPRLRTRGRRKEARWIHSLQAKKHLRTPESADDHAADERQFLTQRGDLHLRILPENNAIERGYDTAGRLVSIQRKIADTTPGERILFILDGFGQRIREDLQRWNGTTWHTESFAEFIYSSRCHFDKIIYADGAAAEFAYDCEGRLAKEWDPNHPSNSQQNPPSKIYTYDELDRPLTSTQPWGGIGGGVASTRLKYDAQDHLTEVVDPNGNVIRNTYSDRDLLTKEESEISGISRFDYNHHKKFIRRIDSRGSIVQRAIDPLDRVSLVDYPRTEEDVIYIYDDSTVPFSKGRLSAIIRGSERVDYRYDRFGRLAQDGNLTFSYDKNGNRLTVNYPDDVSAIYTYDFADRQASLAIKEGSDPPQSIVDTAKYRALGPLTNLSLNNGLVERHLFDDRNLPVSIGVSKHLDWTYATDATGNITEITDSLDAESSRRYSYQNYQYYLNQADGPWGHLSWTYDRAGNRRTETRDEDTITYTYHLNEAGENSSELLLTQSERVDPETVAYRHDHLGNLTHISKEDLKIQYRYNTENRLSQIVSDSRVKAGAVTNMSYDGRGFLVSLALTSESELMTPDRQVRALYGSDGLLYQRSFQNHATPRASRNASVVNGVDDIFYFNGRPVAQLQFRSLTSIDGSVDVERKLLFLSTDHLHTPILATSATGDLLWRDDSEPFGRRESDSQDIDIFLSFPGQWQDKGWTHIPEVDDLHYNLMRWYLAPAGRYNQPDPFGLHGSSHMFAYAEQNTISFMDPTGQQSLPALQFGFSFYHDSLPHIPGVDPSRVACGYGMWMVAKRLFGQRGLGWRYTHCMASCWASRACGNWKGTAQGIGLSIELGQAFQCIVNGKNCHSALAPTDFEDNRKGTNCPWDSSCEDQCREFLNKNKEPGDFGPLDGAQHVHEYLKEGLTDLLE